MTAYQKIRHTLPADVKAQLRGVESLVGGAEFTEIKRAYAYALRNAGWTLQSVADLYGVSREMVRQMAEKADGSTADGLLAKHGLVVPEIPMKPVKPKREFIEPSPDTLARLLELQPMAQAVRSFSPKFRAEAEEYTRLLDYAHTVEGVTLYRLAKRLGVTHGALRFRLARYGYKQPVNGSSRVYQPVLNENRAI
jgi:transcriptional regulator with XRE-family HTH domain